MARNNASSHSPASIARIARIVVADDHQTARRALCELLEHEPGVEVVGEAADGREAVRQAHELKPDVVLMDVAMPEVNGIEATRRIVASLPGVRVIAVSMHDDRRFVEAMLEAGATAYVRKDDAYQELPAAIRRVMDTCVPG